MHLQCSSLEAVHAAGCLQLQLLAGCWSCGRGVSSALEAAPPADSCRVGQGTTSLHLARAEQRGTGGELAKPSGVRLIFPTAIRAFRKKIEKNPKKQAYPGASLTGESFVRGSTEHAYKPSCPGASFLLM